jgi:flagellar basal-body rod protein FlgF
MDRALYVAMTGASQTLRAQAANSHNLANASTIGFKAELASNVSAAVRGPGLPTRVNALLADAGWDARSGALQQTGRELDVALRDGSWLAVQAPDGSEAYTRAGDLRIDAAGQLRTGAGHAVLGDGGPLSVPPATAINIGADGTLSAIPLGQSAAAGVQLGRLRVVDAQPEQLQRGADGLMRVTPGAALNPAAGDSLTSGVLESSNVNLADAMVTMIQLARQFEMQTKAMRTVEENARASASLVRMGG